MSLHKRPSYFKHPFGARPSEKASPNQAAPVGNAPSGAPSRSTAEELSREWEILEARIRAAGPSANLSAWHSEVGGFLRNWGVRVAGLPAGQQAALASLLESARAVLLALLSELSRAASGQSAAAQAAAWERQRQAVQQAEHDRRIEAGQAEVRRLQEETARIQAETYASTQRSHDRNHQLARAALFPENHCPYCSRSYLDLNGGCWHCLHGNHPG